jgi:MIP family channel proteins
VGQPALRVRLVVEAVGTFGFFFLGFSGIAAAVNLPGSIGPAGVAAGFGLGLGLMIGAFGQISGGHFNPAVSLGLAAARKFPPADVVPYWIAQVIGGLAAAIAANILYTDSVKDALVNAPATNDWRALLLEAVAVFFFVSVIITVATNPAAAWNGVMAPVLIGGFIFAAALTIGPSSGGSFNPARSLAPAIWAGEFGDVWIYIVGPLLGALVAGGFALYLAQELREAAVEAG